MTADQTARSSGSIDEPRIAVFTAALTHSVLKGVVALVDALPGASFLVVHHAPRKNLRLLLRNQWRNLRRNGWLWIPYQLGDLRVRVRQRFRRPPRTSSARPGSRFALDQVSREPRVEILRAQDIHAASTLERVRAFAPDLGVSLAAPILQPDLFSIPRLGTVNLHKGKVPEYRGMPPAFWELYQGEKEVGCTVHLVETGLDTGAIVRQTTVPIRAHSTLRGLQLTLDEVGVPLMRDAVLDLIDGSASIEPQRPGGRSFRKPTLEQERELADRGERQREGGIRELAKEVVFSGYVHVARPVPRLLLARSRAQRVVVLLYHRVSDELRDSLTVGIEQFDAQMGWLARHYPVVDILDVVEGRVPRDTGRPVVAITFDDGYRDNYEHAFPILLRHRVPAAFFVSTGKMGVNGAFDHDLQRLGRGLPTMNWDQLREMRQAGFTIGSHSVSHLDCGRADLEEVRLELQESRDTLAAQLGVDKPIFAYPFGRKQNMRAQALEIVRSEAYVGCLSAYGGCNEGDIDPFDVRRVAINHRIRAAAFRARLEGWG